MFNIGDRVYDIEFGWGEVIEIDEFKELPIKVDFKKHGNRCVGYTYDGKLDRVPLTATAYKDFLRHYGDSYLKYIWLESSNSERYAIPKEILMHGIIKIEKS